MIAAGAATLAAASACSSRATDRGSTDPRHVDGGGQVCTIDALDAYVRSVPSLVLEDERAAGDGLVVMMAMDQCARELDQARPGLELAHARELRRFLDRFGWPQPGRWSSEVRRSALLLAQHAPDLELQRRALQALEAIAANDRDAAKEHAYLYDRVHALGLGKAQRTEPRDGARRAAGGHSRSRSRQGSPRVDVRRACRRWRSTRRP